MSIIPPVPVLRGDKDVELRCDGEGVVLLRPDDELRIPLAAISRVRAERRDIAVELTAPAGTVPTVYRVTDVSAAAATLFADRVNAMLPERASGEEAVDGTTLVVTRSLRNAAAAEDELEDDWLLSAGRKRAGYAAVAAMALFAVVAGYVGKDPSRAIAVLLLGEVGVGIAFHAFGAFPDLWRLWYLPRHGITVHGQQVFRNGDTTNAYVGSDGVTRYIGGSDKGRPIRVAYHPQKPEIAVRCPGSGDMRSQVVWFLVISAFAAPFLYGAFALALPAFGA